MVSLPSSPLVVAEHVLSVLHSSSLQALTNIRTMKPACVNELLACVLPPGWKQVHVVTFPLLQLVFPVCCVWYVNCMRVRVCVRALQQRAVPWGPTSGSGPVSPDWLKRLWSYLLTLDTLAAVAAGTPFALFANSSPSFERAPSPLPLRWVANPSHIPARGKGRRGVCPCAPH